MSAEIRTLAPCDVQAMRDMLALFGSAFAEPETYLARQPADQYLGDLLASTTFIAVAAFRRRGVSTALIEHLKTLAADAGAWVIFVQADHGDDAAIRLYSKLGCREDVLHFDIEP